MLSANRGSLLAGACAFSYPLQIFLFWGTIPLFSLATPLLPAHILSLCPPPRFLCHLPPVFATQFKDHCLVLVHRVNRPLSQLSPNRLMGHGAAKSSFFRPRPLFLFHLPHSTVFIQRILAPTFIMNLI